MRRLPIVIPLLLLMILPHVSHAELIVGGAGTYLVRKGDSLVMIGARLGVEWQIIAKENGIDPKQPGKIGTHLRVDNRKIVPKLATDGIIINIADRMLYYFKEGRLVNAFPVGLGAPGKDWQTPLGRFTIVRKEKNPIWHVPKSIQVEMEQKGQPVETAVLPGPKNPLGRCALHTSIQGILIHETIWPTTVYQRRSHGCIRVLPEHMEAFFNLIPVGTRGEIIYRPVKIGVNNEKRIVLEVNRDIYRMIKSLKEEVKIRTEMRGLSSRSTGKRLKK